MLDRQTKKIFFNIEQLLKLMPGYSVKRIFTVYDQDDGVKEFEGNYFVGPEDISKITQYWDFGTTSLIDFDSRRDTVYSDNINYDNKKDFHESTYKPLSPLLKIQGNLVYATEDLRKWLQKAMGLSNQQLNDATVELLVTQRIRYNGAATAVKMNHGWSYSSEPPVLTEKQIEDVLNCINDEQLRKQIECILTANIFERI